MRKNNFLQQGYLGNQHPAMQMLSLGLTWFAFLIIGSIPISVPYIALLISDPARANRYAANPTNFELLGWDMNIIFLLLMCQFLTGLLGLYVSQRWLLKRPLLSAITGDVRFRWKRYGFGLGVWMAFMFLYQVATYIADPDSLTFTADWAKWIPFFGMAILLVPLQSAFEEIAVRGQFLQFVSRWTPRLPPLVPMMASSMLFAMLHILNNEVTAYGIGIMMAHYFTFGLVLAAFSMMDEGLELAIGIHAGNNIYSLCLVGYPGASLKTPTLFQQGEMAALQDFLAMLGFVTLAWLVFYGRRKGSFRALFSNIGIAKIDPLAIVPEPAQEPRETF